MLVGEGADELFGGYFRELRQVPAEEREQVAQRLVEIAYNTALRRLDRGWLANSVNYRAPFLDGSVVALSEAIPFDLKVHGAEESVEKWILREAFRDLLPKEIAGRPKLRFSRGSGVDDLMTELTAGKVSEQELAKHPRSSGGIPFNSPKELLYYRSFRKDFPPGYERLTVRWDPFK
ncbi:MAG: asparagine synthase-related protein [Candidatus Bipolaricaulaceae bacterium]